MSTRKPKNNQSDVQDRKIYGVYGKSVLETKVILSINEIGKNIKPNLENKITSKISGKCIAEGFIKPSSIKVLTYSSGTIAADKVEYHVVFECMICAPVEGMLVECTTKTITKAGIHSQIIDDEGNVPVTVFIARDHHHIDQRFHNVKENDKITARIIGIRFELNDSCICAIATLNYDSIVSNEKQNIGQKKPKIRVLGGDEEAE
jgi:DNA-directed RNA polymerase subunit E'/Rpb7